MNPPFRADQVGSLLRPTELTEARAKAKRGEIDAAALRAVEELSRPRAAARFFTSRTQTLAYRGASCRDAELNNGHAGNGQDCQPTNFQPQLLPPDAFVQTFR